MKTIKFLIAALILMTFVSSCETPVENFSSPTSSLIAITAQFADESISTGQFTTSQKSPFGDTIRIQFPKYFPTGSNKPIDISNMRIKATIPVNVRITPSLTVMDLNVPNTIYITNSDKTVDKHVIIGELIP